MAETAARWESREAENSGRLDISVAGMLGWSWGAGFNTSLSLQRMVTTFSAKGDQLELPWTLSLGLGWRGDVLSD